GRGPRRVGRSERAGERLRIVAGRPFREPSFDHRSVERDHAALSGEPRQQRGVVAVADEGLRRAADLVPIEPWEDLDAAVAAAEGDERADRRIGPGLTERRRADEGFAGGIARAREDRLVVHRLVTEASQLGDAGVELEARERARGGDESDPIARSERARL